MPPKNTSSNSRQTTAYHTEAAAVAKRSDQRRKSHLAVASAIRPQAGLLRSNALESAVLLVVLVHGLYDLVEDAVDKLVAVLLGKGLGK